MLKYLIMVVIFCLVPGCMHLPYSPMNMMSHPEPGREAICPVSKTPVIITETTPSAVYKNRIYYFTDDDKKAMFMGSPEEYINGKNTEHETVFSSVSFVVLGLVGIVIMAVMMGIGK
jgi:YHS domain-containing protein